MHFIRIPEYSIFTQVRTFVCFLLIWHEVLNASLQVVLVSCDYVHYLVMLVTFDTDVIVVCQ